MVEEFPKGYLSRLIRGESRAIGTVDPSGSLAQLEEYVSEELPRARMVGLRLGKIQSHDGLLSGCVQSLASAAMALWPDWYNAESSQGRAATVPKEASALWMKQAEMQASVGHLPIVDGFPQAEQVRQLALALGGDDLILGLATSALEPSRPHLKSIVAVAIWLAQHAKAKGALLVPMQVLDSEELDKLPKGKAVHLEDAPAPSLALDEIPTVTVTSIFGRPNPTSPGEIELSKRLGKSSELAGLFCFNKTIQSIHGKEYRVDLVWPDGKLVVEVDGYGWHSSTHAFGQDRHRDYELMITGYRVLRLTHTEIMKDGAKSLAKIRDCVNFIRNNGGHGG